jgi:hypothetical protein
MRSTEHVPFFHAPAQLYQSQSVEGVQDTGDAFWLPQGHVKLGLRFDVSKELVITITALHAILYKNCQHDHHDASFSCKLL